MTRLYANNLSTTLDGAITDVATTMTLTDVSDFPAVGSGDTAQITITDGTNTEIVTATAISGSVVTITRGQEGTSGTAFADLDTVELRETALSFTDVLGGDSNPTLLGELDASDGAAYIGFGGSSSTTAYNLVGSGGVPRLTGAANYMYTFTSSALVMQAGTSWNEVKFANDANRLTIRTNNSERMQVDDSGVNISNGDLVVNTGDLEVTTGDILVSSAASITDTSGSEMLDLASNGASAVNHIKVINHTTGNAPTVTSAGDDASVDLELDTQGTGDVVIPDASLKIQSDSKPLYLGAGDDATIQYDGTDLLVNPQAVGSGNLVLSAGNFEGAGISFDSGTNILDEYEEGTWSAVLSDATTGGNVATYGTLTRRYTRIGRVVHMTFRMTNIDTTGMTAGNTVYVQGLPFTSTSSAISLGPCQTNNITGDPYVGMILNGKDYMRLDLTDSSAVMKVSDITSTSGEIRVYVTYETDA